MAHRRRQVAQPWGVRLRRVIPKDREPRRKADRAYLRATRYPLGSAPSRYHHEQRNNSRRKEQNRHITKLGLRTVVAAMRARLRIGGDLLLARWARNQGWHVSSSSCFLGPRGGRSQVAQPWGVRLRLVISKDREPQSCRPTLRYPASATSMRFMPCLASAGGAFMPCFGMCATPGRLPGHYVPGILPERRKGKGKGRCQGPGVGCRGPGEC